MDSPWRIHLAYPLTASLLPPTPLEPGATYEVDLTVS
jgi:hypothetical protein